jgi:hypothetical protein
MSGSTHTEEVIDLREESECRRWSARFGVRPKELKAVLRSIGNKVRDVERYFADRKPYSATVFPVSRRGE